MAKKRRANGEGSIYVQKKDKNGKPLLWATSYIDNAGVRRTLYGKSQQIVKDKLKEAIKESDSGMRVDKSKIMFAEWLEDWLEVYSRPVTRPSTYSNYYGYINNHIIPAFYKVTLKDLRTDMLQKFFNEKFNGLSVSSLKQMKFVITMALDKAIDDGVITQNVAKKIMIPTEQRKEVQILTTEQQKQLEGVLHSHSNPLAFSIILALYTGLRMGELIGLKLTDIDMEEKELYVRRTVKYVYVPKGKNRQVISEPKTPKSKRIIPLPGFIIPLYNEYIKQRDGLLDAMREQWKAQNKNVDEDFLFITYAGAPTCARNIGDIFKRTLKRAGLEHIKFHALRHTFATRCLEAGFDIKSLSDILGHTDAKMTLNIYAHALPDQKRSNMDKLTPLFNPSGDDEK